MSEQSPPQPVELELLTADEEGVIDSPEGALEDVPLTVEVEIGHIDVPLEEVKHFGKGTRLPLAAAVGDPATLLLNGHPVALGDLVVVGDHYAVRITRLLTGSEGSAS
ncbi:MAG: FliM/FliN family flagellar motor switch protein [Clostridia bacterium]